MASGSTLVTYKPNFLGIPTECRVRIYQHVFSGMRLNLKDITGELCQQKRHPLLKENSTGTARTIELIACINDSKTAILFTCRQFLVEGPEFLAKAATLVIKSVSRRQDPTGIIVGSFLTRVSNFEIDFDAFVHVDRQNIEAIKNITIVKAVEGIEESDAGYHILTCKKCGGKNAKLFIEDVMHGTQSWQWFMKQIVHLSKEEGWNVVLSARLEYTMKPADHYLEILANLETLETIRKEGVWNGKVVELEDWLECFESYELDTEEQDGPFNPYRTWMI